jgi:putative hydrolase of the HAD superfamily
MCADSATIKVIKQFRREHERLRQMPTAELKSSSFEEQLRRTAIALSTGTNDVAAVVNEWMFNRPRPLLRTYRRNHLVARIRSFRELGGRTAVVSDYPALFKLEAMDLLDDFDVVLGNGEPGSPYRLKPQPDGLLEAAQRLGVEPNRCLVIGDRPEVDGVAALRAGMHFAKPTWFHQRRVDRKLGLFAEPFCG